MTLLDPLFFLLYTCVTEFTAGNSTAVKSISSKIFYAHSLGGEEGKNKCYLSYSLLLVLLA
jgi:hypothetical protein